METLRPRIIGAKNTAVPTIMSVMDFRRTESSLRVADSFWNCLPTATASLPASSVSWREHLQMSRRVLETLGDIGDTA